MTADERPSSFVAVGHRISEIAIMLKYLVRQIEKVSDSFLNFAPANGVVVLTLGKVTDTVPNYPAQYFGIL
jgi:hypothetical protein